MCKITAFIHKDAHLNATVCVITQITIGTSVLMHVIATCVCSPKDRQSRKYEINKMACIQDLTGIFPLVLHLLSFFNF